MRIFLTGATGFVGGHLRRVLVQEGHQVVGFARHSPPLDEGVQWVAGEITDVDALRDGMDGCQAVIHLVGIIREQGEQTFERMHVQATEAVLAAMRRLQISRILHMSALGAGPKATSAYFRTKWQAEEAVRASGCDYTIFRPSIIFGPGDGFMSLLASQLRRYPVIPVIGRGEYLLAPIAIQAVAAAYAQALQMNGETKGRVFELCGPEALTYMRILAIIARQLQVRKRYVHLPLSLVSLAVHLARLLHLPTPITRDQLNMLVVNNVCHDDSALTVFDLPRISVEEGIRAYIQE